MIQSNKPFLFKVLALSFILGLLIILLNSWIVIPLGLIYSLFIPGFLTLLTIQRSVSLSWSSIIYSLGLGITQFTFLALFVNVIGHTAGNNRPLTIGTLVTANFILIALLGLGHKRWQFVRPDLSPHFTKLEKWVLAGSFLLLISVIVGAISLNNTGSGIISFLCFLAIPLVFILLFWKSKSLRSNVVITSLWLIAISLLFSGWLRSWYVSGPDISLEYRLAEIVSSNNLWSLDTIKHAYNACLSVSLFAPALGILTKSSLALVFKFIIPFLYSFVVPIVYLITQRFLQKRGGIIAAAFFMAQPVFVVWWWIPIRQQIAFLLFGAALLLITEFKAKTKQSILILLILSLGLVVAHYTTALMAITYFIVVWIVATILSKNKRFKSIKSPIPFAIIILLVVSYFVWYAQLAYGFSGVTQFVTKSLGGISELITPTQDDESKGQKDILSQLNIFSNQKQPQVSLEEYADKRVTSIRNAYSEKNMYSSTDTEPYPTSEAKAPPQNDTLIQTIRQLFISISKAIVVVGTIVAVWLAFKNERMHKYAILSLSALLILGITTVLPSFSVSYDLVRTYQQLLFVMAGIYVLIFLVPRRYRSFGNAAIIGFVSLYFVFTSHTLSYLSSSPSVPANLANQGTEFTYRYAQKTDVMLGEWITDNISKDSTISGDSLARDRLRLTLDPNRSQAMLNTVMPTALPRNGYVIQNTRVNATTAFDSFESTLFMYNYPAAFLSDKKNIIYSNSGSRLFK